jgi:tRNA threonylcarbamoyladenosine modification (KEOPS) complex  Pcc1 subunit
VAQHASGGDPPGFGLAQPASTKLQAKPTTFDFFLIRKVMPSSKSTSNLGHPLIKLKVTSSRLLVELTGRKKILEAVRFSMIPEIDKSQRCVLSVRTAQGGNKLILGFDAKDLVALRAGFNTNLRLVSSALKTITSASSIEKKKTNPVEFTERLKD